MSTPLRSAGPTETAAFLALIDQLDHEPGPFPSDTEIERRVAVMRADAQASRPADSAADSPAFRAFRKLALSRRIGRKQLLAAHALLCADRSDAGRYRNTPCQIRCRQTGVTIHTPPDARRVPALMDRLFDQLNAVTGDWSGPFIGLLSLVSIHPFADGNGRTARTLFAALCWRCGLVHPAYLLALVGLHRHRATPLCAAKNAVLIENDWRSALDLCGQVLAEARLAWTFDSQAFADTALAESPDQSSAIWRAWRDGQHRINRGEKA